MSLLEIALREGNYELATLTIIYGMVKEIQGVYSLLTIASYKRLLEYRNKLFLFKGKFGNRPVWPTIMYSRQNPQVLLLLT